MNAPSLPHALPPLRILVSALGGEGGGVLMNWIVAAARKAGLEVQATSVPGVAQRTGSTSYYIEIAKAEAGVKPVFSLMPMPGRIDVALASELIEAARLLETGFVSPRLTTLITSSSRVYATSEKIKMGDGRFESDAVKATAKALAKECYLLDLEALARDNGTFISATLFGALTGSGVLPWEADISRSVMGGGRSAKASLTGFNAACAAVADQKSGVTVDDVAGPNPEPTQAPLLPSATDLASVPDEVQTVLSHGYARVCDFQDAQYGQLYLDRATTLTTAANHSDPIVRHALEEACRRLALWMAYEDVARVADLKTRPERFDTIRAEVQLEPGQILQVTEYLKPRAEEIAAVLPASLGRRIMRRVDAGKGLPFLGKGIYLRSTSVSGFYLLRLIAALRHIRKRSLRYHEEQAAIEVWLEAVRTALIRSPIFAAALAELPRVLKGYSDTQLRGQLAYHKIMETIVTPAIRAGSEEDNTRILRSAISAALADEKHVELDNVIAVHTGDVKAVVEPMIPILR